MEIGFCDFGEYQGSVIIPSLKKRSAKLFCCSLYGDDWMKYKNQRVSKDLVFNDLNIDWDDDIVIVEGRSMQHDKNCILFLGSFMRESQALPKICRSKREVFLALDEDAKNKVLHSKSFVNTGLPVNISKSISRPCRDATR